MDTHGFAALSGQIQSRLGKTKEGRSERIATVTPLYTTETRATTNTGQREQETRIRRSSHHEFRRNSPPSAGLTASSYSLTISGEAAEY